MDSKTTQPSAADVSHTAEKHQARNEPDSFPPEGTDENVLTPGTESTGPLSENDRLKATKGALHHKP